MDFLGGEGGTSLPLSLGWGPPRVLSACHTLLGTRFHMKAGAVHPPALEEGGWGAPSAPQSQWSAAGPGIGGQDWVRGSGWSFSCPVPWTGWLWGSAPGGQGPSSSPLATKGTSWHQPRPTSEPKQGRLGQELPGMGPGRALGEVWPGGLGHQGSGPHFWTGGSLGPWFPYL